MSTKRHTNSRHVNKMKATRFKMGYSQDEIARLLGVTQATYNRIENEVNSTSDEMLERIAEILGLSADELFDEADESKRHLLRKAKKAKEQQLERLLSGEAYNRAVEHEGGVDPRAIPTILKELKSLADEGVITEAECQEKKRDLLARL